MTPRTLLLASTDFRADTRTRDIALIVTGSLLLAVAAQIRVHLPWTPVPVTLQTLVVGLLGMLLGARRAGLAAVLYLTEGAAGLPFFTGAGAGIGALTAVTGGYLLCMPLGAALVGRLTERGWDRSPIPAFFAFMSGSLLVMAGGTFWLSHLLGSWNKAFTAGFAPFFVGDMLKAASMAITLPALWHLKSRLNAR